MSSKQPKKSNSGDSSKALSPKLTKDEEGLGEVDLNADMGEGSGNDEHIMPFISSASIACGYHAGDEKTIWQTMELAIKNKVAIGAHVSFPDKHNFGRTEMNLSPGEVYDLITQQLIVITEIADGLSAKLKHVKPHGALYNMSAKDAALAKAIASAVKDFDENLLLFGLSGSHSIREATAAGLRTASEVFADRTYSDNGSLTPRSQPNAMIEDVNKSIQQVVQMIKRKTVTTDTGKEIAILAETICIHGDSKHAAAFARTIFDTLKQNNIAIKAI